MAFPGKLLLTKSRVLAALLGFVLVAAAVLKVHEFATGTEFLGSRWTLLAVIEIELLLGLWLIGGMAPKGARLGALGCFSVFVVISAWHTIEGHESCGCLGNVRLNPWVSLTFDLAAVTALWYWRPNEGQAASRRRQVLFATLTVILASVGVIAVVRTTVSGLTEDGNIKGDAQAVRFNPETWIGKRLPLLKQIDIGQELSEGDWTLILYQHNCSLCEKVLSGLEEGSETRAMEGERRRVVLIEMSGQDKNRVSRVSNASGWRTARLDGRRTWLVTVPAILTLRDGRLMGIRRGLAAVSNQAAER